MSLSRIVFSVEGDVGDDRYVSAPFGLLAYVADQAIFPHVCLSFGGPAHPFVYAVRAASDDHPRDYLVIAPRQDERVYLLPAQARRFIPEESTRLRIFCDGPLVEAEVEEPGRGVQSAEAVRWDFKIWEKRPARRIILVRKDGGSASVELTREGSGRDLWARANQQLAAWAATAPDGGPHYHLVAFTIDYGAPKYWYQGSFRLKKHDTQLANLGRRIRAYAEPRAGRFRLPIAPYAPDYSPDAARQQIEANHAWLTRVVGKASVRYRALLEHYEILSEPSVEPDARA